MEEALIEIYLVGVSVRHVEDNTEALLGTKVFHGIVRNLNKKAYKNIKTWRTRLLCGNCLYVYVDGVYLKPAGEARFRMFLSCYHCRQSGWLP